MANSQVFDDIPTSDRIPGVVERITDVVNGLATVNSDPLSRKVY